MILSLTINGEEVFRVVTRNTVGWAKAGTSFSTYYVLTVSGNTSGSYTGTVVSTGWSMS